MTTTSITDKPINKLEDNLLGIDNYSNALSEFILESATPLTIGMQGEWGTGKTSLMYLVKEILDKKSMATSWVNTWEYSLFKEPYETIPAVLKGLMGNLITTCKELNYWGGTQKLDEATDRLKKGFKILGSFVAQAALKKTTGMTMDLDSSTDSLISEVAELKIEIQKLIDLIIEDDLNPLKKVVFFVDDLDRIDPPVAVEVLEALKNIFDLDNCIFILAIDYDVIIKGLEKKFGKKTDQNEREFRSFFDKIIQVPFSMPTAAYDIDMLLKTKLGEMGLEIDTEIEAKYIQIVKLTVGYIPRSIKRYVNSYSLLKKIRSLGSPEDQDKLVDFCLFALLGLQISYPKIFRLITKNPDYLSWDKSFAILNGVDNINVPDETAEFTDEEWEQVLWSFCQLDPYLKARALSIIEALNLVRETLGTKLLDVMDVSMEFASMTSVDDDVETKHIKKRRSRDSAHYIVTDPDGKEYRTDDLVEFCEEHSTEETKLLAGPLRKVAQKLSKHSKRWTCRYADDNYIATDPDGREHKIHNIIEFCKEHNLYQASMRKVARGLADETKGWKCRYGELN